MAELGSSKKVVILETDRDLRDQLRWQLRRNGYLVFCFEKETTCLDNLEAIVPELVLIGALPVDRVFRLIYAARRILGKAVILIRPLTSGLAEIVGIHGFERVRVMDFKQNLVSVVFDAITESTSSPYENAAAVSGPDLVGNSSSMLKIKKILPEIAATGEPVLIRGEAGCGKSALAREVHLRSRSPAAPFVVIHGNASDDNGFSGSKIKNLEAALHSLRGGLGTLFLDEISGVPATFQQQVLDLMQQGDPLSNGAGDHIQIVASTRKRAENLMETGAIRKDLFFRLSVLVIDIPALRYRKGDIALLTDYFADRYCRELGIGHVELSGRVGAMFENYGWPGNVSQLQKAVKACIVSQNPDIYTNFLEPQSNAGHFEALDHMCRDIYRLAELGDIRSYLIKHNGASLGEVCNEFVGRAEKKVMAKALETTRGNRKKAADLLDISYKTLLNKIKVYQLAGTT